MIKIEDFDYELPQELIAQEAMEERDECRLLVVDRVLKNDGGVKIQEKIFKDIADELGKNDVLVLNESRVFPARLVGKKDSGGRVELLLLKRLGEKRWEAICKPGLKEGKKLIFGDLRAEVVEDGDKVEVEFEFEGDFFDVLKKEGKTPIPPYIHNENEKRIREDYQTVYANKFGSAAAPTAGLHFTQKLLDKLISHGVQIEKINLNVGLGTFKPVTEKNLESGKLHSEYMEIGEEVAKRLNLAKRQGKRIIAVGTTSVRVLESMSDEEGNLEAGSGETQIFIKVPYRFKFVDSLITNFHLPKSSLLMLVSAMIGDNWREVYDLAVKNKYRFFSFGDAMWIR